MKTLLLLVCLLFPAVLWAASASDDFNRDDEGPPPSASWTSTTMKVVSNQLAPNADNIDADAKWTATFARDQEVSITVVEKANGGLTLITRWSAAESFMYQCEMSTSNEVVFWRNEPEIGFTELYRASFSYANGDVLRFRTSGGNPTSLALFKNGALAHSYSDTSPVTPSASNIGLYHPPYVGSGNVRLDNFLGGDLVAPLSKPRVIVVF